MQEARNFSVIIFFNELRALIGAIDVFPLSTDNITVHQDLFKMLGDDDLEFVHPFASIVMDRPRSFKDLLFSLELYQNFFEVSIDSQAPVTVMYDDLQISEKALAATLVELLVGLSNGQVFALITHIDEDEPQAVEVLYKQKGAQLYTVLRTYAFFTKSSKVPNAQYSVELHRNSFEIDEVKVNRQQLEYLFPLSLDTATANRKPFNDLSSPLTSEEYKSNVKNGSELGAQNTAARFFPGYDRKKPKVEKLVAYAYYRYVEVIAAVVLAGLLLTLDERPATVNVLAIAGVIVFAIIASMYLKRVARFMQVLGLFAYAASAGYILFFLNIELSGFWQWVIAILALEPIIEMLLTDIYKLTKKKKRIT